MSAVNDYDKLLVFISHCSADKGMAKEIAMLLETENIRVWYDEWDIPVGESVSWRIKEALGKCSHFVLIWSKSASTSMWVGNELSSVLEAPLGDGFPRIIPVKLDDTPLPSSLGDVRYIRYRDILEENRCAIVKAITGKNPSSDFKEALIKRYHDCIYRVDATSRFEECPECNNSNLRIVAYFDETLQGERYVVECLNCNWYKFDLN